MTGLQPFPYLSETLPNTFILTKPLFQRFFLCYTKYLRRGKTGKQMAQFKNKVYSNTSKGSSRKDVNSYWYHRTQELKQDKLIKQWQESKGKSSNT